ncbi:MAG TPA: hypothetical protein VLZ84_12300 [Asticcacaulis sp.]|nr:hypothetical protein [Asticcacaulis sp.]
MNDQTVSDRGHFKPFTRMVSAPPAWPWDQARAARLEAQHTSPVSGDDVSIVVRRLKSWALGEPGKFVAIYLRGVDIRQGLKFDLDVQGQKLTIDMPSPQQKAGQMRQGLWRIGLTAAMAACVLAMGSLTLHRRATEADRLTAIENQLARKAREATGIRKAKADALALQELGLGNRTMDQALADLKTLSLKRDPAARLDAFYWNKGYWAVEVRGTEAPVKDATVALRRSDKSVRRDVWLWVSANEDGQR